MVFLIWHCPKCGELGKRKRDAFEPQCACNAGLVTARITSARDERLKAKGPAKL